MNQTFSMQQGIVNMNIESDADYPSKRTLSGSRVMPKLQATKSKLSSEPKNLDQYTCDICSKSFAKMKYLKQHIVFHGEKQHSCDTCGKSFSLPDGLRKHARIPSGEKLYKCQICEEKYTFPSNLTKHLRTHSGHRPYECESCDKSFSRRENLKRHKLIHIGVKHYFCGECGKSFSQTNGLKYHMTHVHTEAKRRKKTHFIEPFEKSCKIVDSLSTLGPDIKRGNVKYDDKKADVIRKSTVSESSVVLRQPIVKSTEENIDDQYTCDLCCKSFAKKIYLKKHLVFHEEKKHSCNTCGKSFSLPDGLRKHERIHTGEKLYKCHICEKKFRFPSNLTNHLRTHSGNRPSCDKSFTLLDTLKRHSLIHNSVKHYFCGECGRSFYRVDGLKQHMLQVHTEAKSCKKSTLTEPFDESCNTADNMSTLEPYILSRNIGYDNKVDVVRTASIISESSEISEQTPSVEMPYPDRSIDDRYTCDICFKSFAKLVYLKKHMVFHGEKIHLCEMCGASFTSPAGLTAHRKIHSGEKPYKCEICGRKFTFSTTLARHNRTHSKDRPFKCKIVRKHSHNFAI